MVELGIVGKPNAGKSTFFSAATLHVVPVEPRPFTTIEPNFGVAYVRHPCPHQEIGRQCSPRRGFCVNGTRFTPIKLVDVAGLVEGAHAGRGLGNQFLDNLRVADALIHVVDASGSTDGDGNRVPIGYWDPARDVEMLEREIVLWIRGIMERDWGSLVRRARVQKRELHEELHRRLSGLGFQEEDVREAFKALGGDPASWGPGELEELARRLIERRFPITVVANKADIAPRENVERLVREYDAVPASADFELLLKLAAKKGLIEYVPGSSEFRIKDPSSLTEAQLRALKKVEEFLAEFGSTGVQQALEKTVFESLDMIVVFPVEDENRWTDKEGNVLPDALLLKRGSTALDLAYKVHTELGEGFIRAVDGRTKRILGRDHQLEHLDVVKIVART